MGKFYDVAPLEGFEPTVGALLASLDDSTREWRENLGKTPVQAIVWQARTKGHSIGSLILHMIDCESYWFESFVAGKRRDKDEVKLLLSDEVQQDVGHWPVPPAEPIDWYYALHDRIRLRSREALRGVEPDRRFERKNFTATLRWVVAHVVEHDSYHGGQAVLLHDLWAAQRKSKRLSRSIP